MLKRDRRHFPWKKVQKSNYPTRKKGLIYFCRNSHAWRIFTSDTTSWRQCLNFQSLFTPCTCMWVCLWARFSARRAFRTRSDSALRCLSQNNRIATVTDETFCKGNTSYYIRSNMDEVRLDGNPLMLSKHPNSFICLQNLPIGWYNWNKYLTEGETRLRCS